MILDENDDQKIEDQPKEDENLPPVDPEVPEKIEGEPKKDEISAEERARKLELELAEARGELKASKRTETPVADSQEAQYWRTKSIVSSDMSQMDEDAFRAKYGQDKGAVRLHYVEYEANMRDQKSAERIARVEAENDLLAKYPGSYSKYKSDVAQALEDASPEVKRDPAKLARFMERQYFALSRDEKRDETRPSPRKVETVTRRIVNPDFESGSGKQPERRKAAADDEELTGEDLEVGRHFGIRTKAERDKYSGRYLEINFGNGVIFRDKDKGFEKVVKK